jgi:hypothetical protein
MTIVRPTFDAYLATTAEVVRSVPAEDGPYFVYPDNCMTTDLVFFWALFVRVYEAVGNVDALSHLMRADERLMSDVRAIVRGDPDRGQQGSFWRIPDGQVPADEAIDIGLGDVLRTLRNGFAHSHWAYVNLSGFEYWQALGWETTDANPKFDLEGRPARNYTMYVADGRDWDPTRFWSLDDLRILITPSHILRYHLHRMLNWMLHSSTDDLFGAERA